MSGDVRSPGRVTHAGVSAGKVRPGRGTIRGNVYPSRGQIGRPIAGAPPGVQGLGGALSRIRGSAAEVHTQLRLDGWERETSDPWVLDSILRGYRLQFRRRPPPFFGVPSDHSQGPSPGKHFSRRRGDTTAERWHNKSRHQCTASWLLFNIFPGPQKGKWATPHFRPAPLERALENPKCSRQGTS